MTKKRMVAKLAKEIRENTKRDFVNSMELAKAFLRNKTQYEETDKSEGFVYEYDSELSKVGRAYPECMFFTGEIYFKDSQFDKWKIPTYFYVTSKS